MAKLMAVLGVVALLVLGAGCGSSGSDASTPTTALAPRVVGTQCLDVGTQILAPFNFDDPDPSPPFSNPNGELFYVWSDGTMSKVEKASVDTKGSKDLFLSCYSDGHTFALPNYGR